MGPWQTFFICWNFPVALNSAHTYFCLLCLNNFITLLYWYIIQWQSLLSRAYNFQIITIWKQNESVMHGLKFLRLLFQQNLEDNSDNRKRLLFQHYLLLNCGQRFNLCPYKRTINVSDCSWVMIVNLNVCPLLYWKNMSMLLDMKD